MVSRNKFFLSRLLAMLLLPGAAVFAQSPAHYTISGQVFDAGGRNGAGIHVCADRVAPPSHDLECTLSTADGQFTIKLSTPGRYQVITGKEAEGYMPQVLPFFRHSSFLPPEVTVDDSTPIFEVSAV
jgi:hypothetical protein